VSAIEPVRFGPAVSRNVPSGAHTVNGTSISSRVRALIGCGLILGSGLARAQNVDLVGGLGYSATDPARAKGNSYEVMSSTTLTQAEFYLNFTGSQTLRFTVHSSPIEFGTYNEIFQTSSAVNGVGPGWYSPGPISVPFVAGTYYIVAVSWSGTMTYYFSTGDSQPVSFGSEVHGYAIGSHPLPPAFSSSVNDFAIYHQRLTTQTVAPGPLVYCTAGTTTNGCEAQIAANGNPSVGLSTPCQIQITGVEGQKSGILFYGLGSLIQPWCAIGGTSLLCVKAPTMRTGAQTSGGTIAQCDGSLSLDWNAFQSFNPGALGSPWSAGNKAFVQGWFRDPPACKTTALSNAVELTYVP
jgi:hypothetical protein